MYAVRAIWCTLRGASYVVQAMWCKLRGASCVVLFMGCNLCGAVYVVQAMRCSLCGKNLCSVSYVVQATCCDLCGAMYVVQATCCNLWGASTGRTRGAPGRPWSVWERLENIVVRKPQAGAALTPLPDGHQMESAVLGALLGSDGYGSETTKTITP